MAFETPLVTVIIPAYNAAPWVERTLRSVLTQTYQNLEVLVVDDGSTDDTTPVVTAIAHQDPRVRLLHQANAGVAAARNLAIAQARGEFIAPIDADDLWYPENLEKQVQRMIQGGPGMGLVYSWSVDIDENDALMGGIRATTIQGDVYATLVCHNFLGNASASMMRRSCLEQVGGYDSRLRSQQAQGCEDWDLYLRIAERYEFGVVPQLLVGYRKLSSSMSCDYSQMARSHRLVMQAVRQKHPQFPQLLYQLSASNLYMYFALQSFRCSQHRIGLYWVGQALKANGLFTLLYLGMWFLVTGLVRHGIYRLARTALINAMQRLGLLKFSQYQRCSVPTSTLTLADLEKQTKAIALTLGIGDMFHRVVSWIAHRVDPDSRSFAPSPERVAP